MSKTYLRERVDYLVSVGDNVAELVDPYETSVSIEDAYGWKTVYHTWHESLIDQLDQSAAWSATGTDGGRTAASRVPVRLDAIDCLEMIRTAASEWLGKHRTAASDVRLQGDVRLQRLKHDVRRLVGVPWTQLELHDLDAEVRSWVSRARVVTGWDIPAFAPHVRCPACNGLGTLRIRLVERTAACVAVGCVASWDPATIGILAEHIRAETGSAVQV